jgi:hypothetical protein
MISYADFGNREINTIEVPYGQVGKIIPKHSFVK